MSTDTLTKRDPYKVLLSVLDYAEPGADWCVDSWRDEADLAGLRGAERSEAQQMAAAAGYLRVLEADRPGGRCLYMRASSAPKAKSRAVQIYERTALRVGEPAPAPHHGEPDQIPGQGLLEVGA